MDIIEHPKIADPARSAPAVHKHFTRYSKGVFDGPIAKIAQSKTGLTLSCSFEYEDELLRIAAEFCPDQEIAVSGKLIGSDDFSDLVKKYGLGEAWLPEKSKGETQNFNVEVEEQKIKTDVLRKISEEFPARLYALLTFASNDGTVKLTTKKTPPRPNSKNPEESSKDNLLKFCSLKLPNNEKTLARAISGLARDVKDEIPSKWKSIVVSNSYEITDLELPKDKNIPSRDFRLLTLRKGNLNRSVEIDGKESVSKKEFVV